MTRRFFDSPRESLECFKRWGGHLFERSIELLDRTEGFSQLYPDFAGNRPNRLKHVLLALSLHLTED